MGSKVIPVPQREETQITELAAQMRLEPQCRHPAASSCSFVLKLKYPDLSHTANVSAVYVKMFFFFLHVFLKLPVKHMLKSEKKYLIYFILYKFYM